MCVRLRPDEEGLIVAVTRMLLVCAFSLAIGGAVFAVDPPPSYDDATLHAVTFVDVTEGWAVGEHGVIWHTVDGGQTWERQKSGTRACLKAIQFLTPYTGFAFGRLETPAGSQSVILKTENGGLNWTESAVGIMPGLCGGKFFDAKNAIVVSDTTAAFPTGVFATTDGGATWKTVDGPKFQHWTSAEFKDAGTGVLVGRNGIATIQNGRPELLKSGENCMVARYCGSNLIMGSLNRIGTLGSLMPIYPYAMSSSGSKIMTVGQSTKHNVLVSDDEGVTWVGADTKLPVTLRAVHMLNGTHAWAVGEFGSILHTNDGGKTWAVQKNAGQRCAVLVVAASAATVPYDLIARVGGKDGVHCRVLCLDVNCDPARLNAAVRSCGGVSSIVAYDGLITSEIEMFSPSTVVIGPGVDREMVAKACEASKATACFACVDTTAKAGVQWDNTVMVNELAGAVKERCDMARVLFGPAVVIPNVRMLERIPLKTDAAVDADSIVAMGTLPRGGTARRKTLPPVYPQDYLTQCDTIRQARRTIDTIVADPEKLGGPEKALTDLRNALVGLPEDMAARVASLAAADFAAKGQWGYAREVYTFVAESFGTLSEAAVACQWLARFHTSAEVRRRIELGHVKPLPMTIFDTVDDQVKTVSHVEGGGKPIYRFRTGITARKWLQMALDLEATTASFGPTVTRDPGTLRSFLAARDGLGISVPALPDAAKSIRITSTASAPKLDGLLDDECWKNVSATAVNETTGIRFAQDSQFLYVAVTSASDMVVSPVTTRERDADLRNAERVELSLDLTRGGDTPFRFSVDERGRLADDCWGDSGWNPKWFVAFAANGKQWTAEVAIPLAELTGAPVAGKVWGVQVKRMSGAKTLGQLVQPGERADLVFTKP